MDKRYKRKRSCPELKADGYAHHPYDFAPFAEFKYPGSDNVTIGALSRLTKTLDRLTPLRGSAHARRRTHAGLSDRVRLLRLGQASPEAQAALRYLQQAYSIALRNGRVRASCSTC